MLRDLNLDIAPGAVVALLGPNGCGKTTAMAMVAGLVRGPGSVLFDERPLTAYDNAAEVVGTALLPRVFHPGRTARAHLRMIAAGAAVDAGRVDDVLDEVGLLEVGSHSPRSFSLGMRQRLALASCLLCRPGVLVLDEPLNGLDIVSAGWLEQYLRDFVCRGGAVLISSHLLEPIERLADTIVVMSNGKEVARGSLQELRAAYGKEVVRVVCEPQDESRLMAALAAQGMDSGVRAPGVVEVYCRDARGVSVIAHAANVLLFEVHQEESALGDVVMGIAGRSRAVR